MPIALGKEVHSDLLNRDSIISDFGGSLLFPVFACDLSNFFGENISKSFFTGKIRLFVNRFLFADKHRC